MASNGAHVTISEEFCPPPSPPSNGTANRSSYEGWDNPFRPEGELSHEAEELLRQWRQDRSSDTTREENEEANDVVDVGKEEEDDRKRSNGSERRSTDVVKNGKSVEVTRETMPQVSAASKVQIEETNHDEAKRKKAATKGCCSLM